MDTPLICALSKTGFDCTQFLLWVAFFASGILCSGTTNKLLIPNNLCHFIKMTECVHCLATNKNSGLPEQQQET